MIVPSPNLALRRARERLPSSRLPGCPLSRDELASQINAWLSEQTGKRFALDERAIGRWERGTVTMPSPHYRAALRAVLKVDSDVDLGFADRHPSISTTSPSPGERTEPLSVEVIRAMATKVHVADRRHGGGRLYQEVLDYLRQQVAPALFTPGAGAGLYAASASLTEIAGWMAHDSGRDVDARTHFDGAYRFAVAAGSSVLAANMCASMAHLACQTGRPDDGLRIAEAGLVRAGRTGGIAAVVARLQAMKAIALAHHRDHRGCRDALRASERSLTGTNDHDDARWAAHFDEGSLAAETARALHHLADLCPAEHHARTVLALRTGDRIRAQALGRLTLAEILIDTGARDEAADHGHHVATTATDLFSARVRTRLGELAFTLGQAPCTPASQRFLEAVAILDRGTPTEASAPWPV